jgi:hypothetical protein
VGKVGIVGGVLLLAILLVALLPQRLRRRVSPEQAAPTTGLDERR